MNQRSRMIIIGVVVFFVIAMVGGIMIYLGGISQSRSSSTDKETNSLSKLPVITMTPTSTPGLGASQPSNLKTFIGPFFSFNYPPNWGFLTCNNSQNLELDPLNSLDVRRVVCDRAVKPITILMVNRLNCPGETLKLGNYQVIKSKTVLESGIFYHWCLMVGSYGLDITHRVSPSGDRGTSREDFSSQIEQIITTIKRF